MATFETLYGKERAELIVWWLKCLDDADGLTEWEEEFVESVTRQFKAKGDLSDKQCAVLDRLYNEKV